MLFVLVGEAVFVAVDVIVGLISILEFQHAVSLSGEVFGEARLIQIFHFFLNLLQLLVLLIN